MASRRILVHTVELFNYMGEIDDEATYQKTTLRFCYCPTNKGVISGNHGKTAKDEARLYIFDRDSKALSEEGESRGYVPYPEWEKMEDKTKHWTLSDEGDDFFMVQGSPEKFKVTEFTHLQNGSRRMWHFEVIGQ